MIRGDQIIAFEIKVSVSAKLTKGFYTAREDIQPTKTFVLSRTDDTWTTDKGITHTYLGALPEQLSGYATDND